MGKEVLDSNSRVIRIKSWEEFKKLIIENKPASLTYNIERGITAGHLSSLRLILPARGIQYVFIDTAAEERLRKTGIPLLKDNIGNLLLKDEDIKDFVRSAVKRKDLKLHSYWTI